MGWGNCGEDRRGRPIGYCHEATCDHPGCNKDIDRGLAYACGGMHGETEYGCDEYFCGSHLYSICIYQPLGYQEGDDVDPDDTICTSVCKNCINILKEEFAHCPIEDMFYWKDE